MWGSSICRRAHNVVSCSFGTHGLEVAVFDVGVQTKRTPPNGWHCTRGQEGFGKLLSSSTCLTSTSGIVGQRVVTLVFVEILHFLGACFHLPFGGMPLSIRQLKMGVLSCSPRREHLASRSLFSDAYLLTSPVSGL